MISSYFNQTYIILPCDLPSTMHPKFPLQYHHRPIHRGTTINMERDTTINIDRDTIIGTYRDTTIGMDMDTITIIGQDRDTTINMDR